MICKQCNNVIPDDSKFCQHCRAVVEHEEPAQTEDKMETPAAKPTTKGGSKSAFDIIGVSVGGVMALAGLIFFFISFLSIDLTSFGGDFYTYAYKGIYEVARLVSILVKVISVTMIASGTLVGCHYLKKLLAPQS